VDSLTRRKPVLTLSKKTFKSWMNCLFLLFIIFWGPPRVVKSILSHQLSTASVYIEYKLWKESCIFFLNKYSLMRFFFLINIYSALVARHICDYMSTPFKQNYYIPQKQQFYRNIIFKCLIHTECLFFFQFWCIFFLEFIADLC
jgi:hypothetical protein